MSHRLILAALAAAAALSLPAVHSAFTTQARPGESRFAAAAQFAPRSTARPTISGSPIVGSTLTATTGGWARAPQSYAYRWLRCAPGCAPIPSEDQARYTVTGDDAGATLAVEVAATNAGGTTTATSTPTGTVARATYTHVLCADPLTGDPVAGGGALPDGLTFTSNSAAIPDPAPSARCDTRAPVIALGGTSAPATPKPGDAGHLDYHPAESVEVVGGELYRHAAVTNGWASAAGAETCRSTDGCTERGDATDRFAPSNRIPVTGPWRMTLSCERAPSCDAGTEHVLRLFGGRMTLRDTSTPRVAAATGSLLTDVSLSGNETLTLSATDAGAGLYRVRATIDGTTVAVRPFDGCTQRAEFVFAVRRPCPRTATMAWGFDTSAWPRGARLRVVLEDAGRNTTTILNRPV